MSEHVGIHRIVGPTILTYSGAYFDFEDPEQSEVRIVDVAHALANISRFTGHCHRFYSVAEHSVHCSCLVPPEDALAALLHDAAEAYLGDISRPLKTLLADYRALEDRIEPVVMQRLGAPLPHPPSVKQADLAMLALEQGQAMLSYERWPLLDGIPLPAIKLQFWNPATAKRAFLSRYETLIDLKYGVASPRSGYQAEDSGND